MTWNINLSRGDEWNIPTSSYTRKAALEGGRANDTLVSVINQVAGCIEQSIGNYKELKEIKNIIETGIARRQLGLNVNTTSSGLPQLSPRRYSTLNSGMPNISQDWTRR